jgi:hypothetical protein
MSERIIWVDGGKRAVSVPNHVADEVERLRSELAEVTAERDEWRQQCIDTEKAAMLRINQARAVARRMEELAEGWCAPQMLAQFDADAAIIASWPEPDAEPEQDDLPVRDQTPTQCRVCSSRDGWNIVECYDGAGARTGCELRCAYCGAACLVWVLRPCIRCGEPHTGTGDVCDACDGGG